MLYKLRNEDESVGEMLTFRKWVWWWKKGHYNKSYLLPMPLTMVRDLLEITFYTSYK